MFYIYLLTISHIFVYLPSLEFTTFEQQVWSTKMGYGNALSLAINSWKKRNVAVLTAQLKQKSSVSLTVVGLNDSRSVYNIVFSESCEPKRFVRCGKKIERTTTKSISPLQPEHGFYWEKGPEHGQVLIGIRMKKWWWSSFLWMVDVVL